MTQRESSPAEPGPLTSSGPGMLPVGGHEATRRATRRRRGGHCQRGVAVFLQLPTRRVTEGGRAGTPGLPGSPPTLATRVRAGDPRRRRRPFTPHFTSSNSSDPGEVAAPPLAGPGLEPPDPGASASASAAGLQRGPRHHHDDSARPLRAPAHGARHAQGVAEAKPQSAADSCNSRCTAR